MDYEKILLNLVQPMVSDPESIAVKQMESLKPNEVLLYVYAKREDLSHLIGRKGSMASALSSMMSIASRLNGKRITIKFEQI